MLDESNVPVKFFCEETAKEEVRMVTELMNNPASEFATNMIRKAIYSEDFFHWLFLLNKYKKPPQKNVVAKFILPMILQTVEENS